ncbi:MAG TPA: hypothetical protein VK007_01470, partial [Acidimicrobiales bacterium]|nr:hypothetical protein [Acidimicrobiales bacterium]
MTEVLPAPDVAATAEPAPAARRRDRRGLGVAGWLAAGWLVLITVAAILAPVLPIDDPDITDFAVPNNASPGTGGHLLGTDHNG